MLTPAYTRTRLDAAVIALLAFGLLAAPASASRGVYQCDGSLNIPQTEWQAATAANSITCLVNVERTSRGIPALTRDADLAQAANGHAGDMSRRQFFAHVNPVGDGLSARLREAGYGNPGDGWYAAEDLGWGTGERATPNAARRRLAQQRAPPPHPALAHLRGDRRRRRTGRAEADDLRPAGSDLRDGPGNDPPGIDCAA